MTQHHHHHSHWGLIQAAGVGRDMFVVENTYELAMACPIGMRAQGVCKMHGLGGIMWSC